VLIGQLVNVLKDGEPAAEQARGQYTSLEDLVDADRRRRRALPLARSSVDTTLDLDIDAGDPQSSDNPVFYVQYAATRAASVLRNAAEMGIEAPATADLSLLTHPREAELLLALAEFPQVVATAAELREPHRVARYLEEKVAKAAQRFWDDCQVLPKGDEEVAPDDRARGCCCGGRRASCSRTACGCSGVSAPERM
jgi:arginyl-tRNA synthetase